MLRIVMDTNVVWSALDSPKGASRRILELVSSNQLIIVLTGPLFLEYEDVLKRPTFLKRKGLTEQDIDDFLDYLASIAETQSVDFLWRGLLADEDDSMVLECAANGKVDYLITKNIRDFSSAQGRFTFEIVTPTEFLVKWRNQP
jgi:putative PIN family toxin of toxin-antitoxin system